MTINVYTKCRLDPTGEHVIPVISESDVRSLSSKWATITNNHAFISGQLRQTLAIEFAEGSTVNPYEINYATITDTTQGSHTWRYFVEDVVRGAANTFVLSLRMDVMHTWASRVSVRCGWYAESSDRGTYVSPVSPTATSTASLPSRIAAADAAGYRYIAVFTQSNGAPRVVLESEGPNGYASPTAYGVYNSAESYVPTSNVRALRKKIALDRIYAIPADVALRLFSTAATTPVYIYGNADTSNLASERYPGIMLSDAYTSPYRTERTITYSVTGSPSSVTWFGGIDGGFYVPFVSAAGSGGAPSAQSVVLKYTLSSFGLHVIASGGGMARDITSYFDVTPTVNNDSSARNIARVASAVNSGVALIGAAAVGNEVGVVSAGARALLDDDRLRRVTAQHFSTTSGHKIMAHGLGFWAVRADNAADIDHYVQRRGYGCLGVYEPVVTFGLATGQDHRYLRLLDVKVTAVPGYVSEIFTDRLKSGVILYRSYSGYMGATNTEPELGVIVASETDTSTDATTGSRDIVYTGKVRARVYNEGVVVATYMIPATETGVTTAVNPSGQVFLYGGSPQIRLMDGSVCVVDFAVDQLQIVGETSTTITAASSLSGEIVPYTDSEYNILALDLYVQNKHTLS